MLGKTGRFCLPLLLAVSSFSACSTKAKLVAQGGECLLATDCEAGLVCVPQKDGKRICDSDLSGVQMTEDAAAPRNDAGAREGAADAPTDGPAPADAQAENTGPAADAPAD